MYLGIDLGTSGVKTILVDDDQTIVASTTAPLSIQRPQIGWSEQDPADWICATKQAISALKTHYRAALSSVKAIGLSGQMHGATLIDNTGQVLRPCLLWNDTRSYQEAAKLDAQPVFRATTGNIVFPGFTAPKLVWLKNNEPDVFSRVSTVLLPKDYLRLWLTGELCSDLSDASGTSWLNTGKRAWCDDLLARCELSQEQMPRLVEGSQISGYLLRKHANEWAMSGSVAVAGGAGDNAASAIATGTVKSGSALVSLGTSGTLFAANDAYRPNPQSAVHAFCHAIPERWHQMGVVLSATAALNWYAGIVDRSASELTAELGNKLIAPSGVQFLPYIAGERTPHNDAKVRGSFHGLSSEVSRADMTRAVLQGVAFALRDNLEALREAGTELTEVTVVGGGMRSTYWLEIIASTLGVAIRVPQEGDFGAAFGAARLAMLSVNNLDPMEFCKPIKTKMTVDPKPELKEDFERAYRLFKAIYRRNKSVG